MEIGNLVVVKETITLCKRLKEGLIKSAVTSKESAAASLKESAAASLKEWAAASLKELLAASTPCDPVRGSE